MKSSEEKTGILRERAKALAKRSKGIEGEGAYLEVVEFMLAHERYALELVHIREVYPLKEFVPLPGTPGFVLGIINVGGRSFPSSISKDFSSFLKRDLAT